MRSAAEHLEAAGEKEAADRVRKLLGDELVRQNQEQLKQKEAQLQRLRQEIERLRAAVGSPRQVMLEVKIYEISLAKLRTAGVDFSDNAIAHELFGPPDEITPSVGYHAIDKDHPFLATLNAFEQDSIARLISQTCTLAAFSRPASIVRADPIYPRTTEVEFTPQRVSDQRIRLDFRIKLSELCEQLGPDEKGQPRSTVREVATGGEFEKGQILVLGGFKQDRTFVEFNRDTDPPTKRTRSNPTVTLFVIHPQLLDGDAEAVEPVAAGAAQE